MSTEQPDTDANPTESTDAETTETDESEPGGTEPATTAAAEIQESYTSQDPVAVIGAPNGTQKFTAQILEASIDSPLQGGLYVFEHEEGDQEKLVLAQLSDLESDNVWHRKDVLQGVIKKRGALEDLSGDADTKQALLHLVGVFSFDGDSLTTSTLNTPPASGTSVFRVTDPVMDAIVRAQVGTFYAGQVFGSDTDAPLRLRHFGPESNGGYGEGRRIGIFGRAGSGKSVMGANLIGGFAQHPNMGILILDPQGEFTQDRFGNGADFEYSFHDILNAARGSFETVDITQVTLEHRSSFVRLLERTGFFERLGYKSSQKRQTLVEDLTEWMRGRDPAAVDVEDMVDEADDLAEHIYASTDKDVTGTFNRRRGSLESRFDQVQELFEHDPSKTPISDLLDQVLVSGEIVSLDLDPGNIGSVRLDDEEVRNAILYGLMQQFRHRVYRNYQGSNGADSLSNALVVLDEAHEIVSKGNPDDPALAGLKKEIVKSQKTSRKYGVGWMFINQRISDFDLDIYAQLESHIFCAGLGIGADEQHLKDIVGSDMYTEYRSLPDPKSTDIYTHLVSGGIISIGTTGRPIIIEGYDGSDAVIDANSRPAGSGSGS